MAARECKNLWWACRRDNLGKVMRNRMFTRRFWKYDRSYIWHDSFGKFWNRWIACRLLGHYRAQWIDWDNCEEVKHCFACDTRLEGPQPAPSWRKP